MSSNTFDGDALLAKIKPTLRRLKTQVCLRPDLLEQWESLCEELADASNGLPQRLSGDKAKAVKSLEARIADIEDEIEEVSPWFEFEALPAERFRALCADYPPRDKNQIDMLAGFNRDDVARALVRECLISPSFSDEGWQAFVDTCATSEWAELQRCADEVNAGSAKPPKSQAASKVPTAPGSESA